MKCLSAVALGLMMVGVVARAADADPAKLVGTWEVIKSADAPVGTLVTFAADGKLTVVVKGDGKDATLAGTYKVAKDKISVELKVGDKISTEELTVKKFADTEMELEDKDKKLDVLKKKK